jgi:hypothetical protein
MTFGHLDIAVVNGVLVNTYASLTIISMITSILREISSSNRNLNASALLKTTRTVMEL